MEKQDCHINREVTWDKFYLTEKELKETLAHKKVKLVKPCEEEKPPSHEEAVAAHYFFKLK